MGKRTNEERDFAENIDRLLAGEELADTEDLSEEHRTAFSFARKLTGSRIDPSPLFKAQLKERLLSRLAQEEAESARQKESALSFWEFLRNLVPQSPAWHTATVTIVMVLIAVSGRGNSSVLTASPPVNNTPVRAVSLLTRRDNHPRPHIPEHYRRTHYHNPIPTGNTYHTQ